MINVWWLLAIVPLSAIFGVVTFGILMHWWSPRIMSADRKRAYLCADFIDLAHETISRKEAIARLRLWRRLYLATQTSDLERSLPIMRKLEDCGEIPVIGNK